MKSAIGRRHSKYPQREIAPFDSSKTVTGNLFAAVPAKVLPTRHSKYQQVRKYLCETSEIPIRLHSRGLNRGCF